MKRILSALKSIGKAISKALVTAVLAIVYLIVFPFYALFVRFNRNIIEQHKVIGKEDIEKMF